MLKRELCTSFSEVFHGHTCLPFRYVTTLGGDTLAERYERAMARLQQITSAGYTVEVVLECQFDKDILPHHSELKLNPIVQHAPLNTRDALYGGRIEAMVLHYAISEGGSYDVMSLYPFVCNYFNFPKGQPKN